LDGGAAVAAAVAAVAAAVAAVAAAAAAASAAASATTAAIAAAASSGTCRNRTRVAHGESCSRREALRAAASCDTPEGRGRSSALTRLKLARTERSTHLQGKVRVVRVCEGV
jgi:hypothetical protein